MWIELNRKDKLLGLMKGRLIVLIYVEEWKPWYTRFNKMFAYARRRIELCIQKNEKDYGW